MNGDPGPLPDLPLAEEELASLTDAERDRVRRIEEFMQEQFGYIAIQSTRPQTLAYGLTDSPVGQLAWIMDKFREWTHPRETLPDEILDRDRLLTNATLYWLTGTAGSSAYVGYAQRAAGAWRRSPRACRPASSTSSTTWASAATPSASTPSCAGWTPTAAGIRRHGGAGAPGQRHPGVLPRPALSAGLSAGSPGTPRPRRAGGRCRSCTAPPVPPVRPPRPRRRGGWRATGTAGPGPPG